MEKKNGRIKKILEKYLNKRLYIAVTVSVVFCCLAAAGAFLRITRIETRAKRGEAIVLPTAYPHDLLTEGGVSGALAARTDEIAKTPPEAAKAPARPTAPPAVAKGAETKAAADGNITVITGGDGETREAWFTGEDPESAFFIALPCGGAVENEFSPVKLRKSATMGDWRVHRGIDIAAEQGSEVAACFGGRVAEVRFDKLWGQTVKIDHGNGFVSVYANLAENVSVGTGDELDAGGLIGRVGATALCERLDAPHLHLELYKDGECVDPTEYAKK